MGQFRVGVIGWPIAHSLSPVIHNAAFKALNMTHWTYDAIAIPPDDLKAGVARLRRQGYIGFNVTVPHKQSVMRLVHPDLKAQAIGTVNTVDLRNDTGTNTDVDGFINDLKAHDVSLKGARVVVLGAGGAARAVVYGLSQAGAEVAIVNRSEARLDNLLHDLCIPKTASVCVKPLEDAAKWCSSLIVNCTPVGMWPKVDDTPWPVQVPCPVGVTAYDLVYRPAKTRFMTQIEEAGGRAITGLGMLVRQAAEAFRLWTGVDAPIEVMFDAARKAMA